MGGFLGGPNFCLRTNAQTGNILSVKYLDDFPGGTGFDSKYEQVNKYLIYKYVEFSFEKAVTVNSAELSFTVDDSWYDDNNIEDVVFLKFDNGSWSRINYNNRSNDGGYKKYQVTSSSIGQYWAIVGVLPDVKILDSGVSERNVNEQNGIFGTVGRTGVINDVVKIGENIILTLKEPVSVKGASTITTTTATVSVATLLAFLGGPANLWIVLQQIGAAFFGLFFSKKKHRSGVVYDADTGIPVSLARVDLVEKKSDRTKSTKFTDKNGRYYFLAPKGGYYLEVRKNGYMIVDNSKAHLLKALLHKSDLEPGVELRESGIIKKNIAILQDDDLSSGKVKASLMVIIKYLANIAFFAGVIISIWSCYVNPTLFNFFVLGIYVLVILFKSFFAKNPKYGTIVNSNGNPEPFATINVLDAKTKKMVSRVISNTKGRYYILLEKGEYILNIKTVKGISVSRRIGVKGKNILSQKLVIQK
jgi:hypothetical protein